MATMRHLLIQSADRTGGTPSDFFIKPPLPIENLKGTTLLSASIPNTLYNITSANNTIYWNRGGALSTTITPGAYTDETISTALAAAMDDADGVQTYTVSYDSTTMKMTIECPAAAFTLTCTSTTNAIWDVLGFDTDANTGSATSHTADNVLRLDFPAYLLITVNEFLHQGTVSSAGIRTNFAISMSNVSQYVEVFNANETFDNSIRYTSSEYLDSLHITLRKPDGGEVDLNGAEWSMLLNLYYCDRQ
jgi:hypothetical protein